MFPGKPSKRRIRNRGCEIEKEDVDNREREREDDENEHDFVAWMDWGEKEEER